MGELKRSNTGNGRMAPYDLKDRGSNRGGNNSNDYGGNSRGRKYTIFEFFYKFRLKLNSVLDLV